MNDLKDNELANEIANAIYNRISGTFADFMANIEKGQKGTASQIEGFQADIKKQINGINRKIVGWTWVIVIAILTLALSVLISFLVITSYHNKYLSETAIKQQHEWQAHPSGTTRAIPMPKTDKEIQAEQDEILKSLKK